MRQRQVFVVIVALAVAACGSKPPAGPSGSTTTVVRAGEYAVFIAASPAYSAGTAVTCFTLTSGSPPPAGTSISFSATITADNGTYTLRPIGAADLGLSIPFRSAGTGTITGAPAGRVRDPVTGDTMSFASLPPNTIPGVGAAESFFIGSNTLTSDPNVFSGSVTGQVTLENAVGSANVCANSTWQMRLK